MRQGERASSRDDWAIVNAVNRGDVSPAWLTAPHNEHWILLPKLVYAALGALVGFDTPWVFVAVTIGLHLVLCHLLWRIAIRGGGDPWLATVAGFGFAV